MQVTTEIDFDLDIEDTMREIAEEVMDANYVGFLTRDCLDGDYVTWEQYHEANNDSMAEYLEAAQVVTVSDLEDGDYIRLGDRYFEGMRTDVAVLANDLEILAGKLNDRDVVSQFDVEAMIHESYEELEAKMEEMDDHAVIDVQHLRNVLDNEYLTLSDYNEYIPDSIEEYLESSDYVTMDGVRTVVNSLTYDTEAMVNKIASLEGDISRQNRNHFMPLFRTVWDLDVAISGAEREIITLKNDLEIARRSIRVLLEDRERTLGRRARRLFTLTCSTFGRMVRRVHWHMPRR